MKPVKFFTLLLALNLVLSNTSVYSSNLKVDINCVDLFKRALFVVSGVLCVSHSYLLIKSIIEEKHKSKYEDMSDESKLFWIRKTNPKFVLQCGTTVENNWLASKLPNLYEIYDQQEHQRWMSMEKESLKNMIETNMGKSPIIVVSALKLTMSVLGLLVMN